MCDFENNSYNNSKKGHTGRGATAAAALRKHTL